MDSTPKISIVVNIEDPAHNRIAHKVHDIRPANTDQSIHIDKVLFSDWIPSGSFGTVALYRGEEQIYSEEKMIPNAAFLQEGAELFRSLTGFQPFTRISSLISRLDKLQHGSRSYPPTRITWNKPIRKSVKTLRGIAAVSVDDASLGAS